MKIVLAAILFIFYIAGNPASIFSKDIEASPIRRLYPIQSAPSETAITTLDGLKLTNYSEQSNRSIVMF